MRKSVALEKVEQQWGVDTLRFLRFDVYVLGHARRGATCDSCGAFVRGLAGTQQTEGISDVFAFTPPIEVIGPLGVEQCRHLLWWEVKREKGSKTSAEQITFARLVAEMRCAQVHHVKGTYNDLIAWLVWQRFARADQFPHYRVAR